MASIIANHVRSWPRRLRPPRPSSSIARVAVLQAAVPFERSARWVSAQPHARAGRDAARYAGAESRRRRKKNDEDEGFQNLPKPLRSRLKRLGVQSPTQFQRQVLPAILEGRDVLGASQIGAGKTVALVAGTLERAWREGWSYQELCVILAPTRSDAEQAYVVANQLRRPSVKVLLLVGEDPAGADGFDPQRALLQKGAHLVIGTPGRVQRMVELGLLRPDTVRLLALDEAEHFVDGSASSILEDGAPTRQLVVFSGSSLLPGHGPTADLLVDPLTVDLLDGGDFAMPQIRHRTCLLQGGATKRARAVAWLLEELLAGDGGGDSEAAMSLPLTGQGRAVVFASTQEEVAMMCTHVMLRHRIVALHAGMPDQDRNEALDIFRASEGQALLTTDSSLRGVDLPRVSVIIHTGPPRNTEVYASRVLRANQEGAGKLPTSVVMHNVSNVPELADLERGLRCAFEELPPPSDDAMRGAAVDHIFRELRLASSQYDAEMFLEDAAGGIETHGSRLLAAALVLLERRNRAEEWLSPLSGRARYTPLLLFDPFLERLKSRQAVVKAVSAAIRQHAEEHGKEPGAAPLGRVELTAKGYVVDVPHGSVGILLRDEGLRQRGISVMPVAHLPALWSTGQVDEKEVDRRPRRQRERVNRTRAPDRRAEKRLEFLFPAGRRTPLGEWQPAGQKDKKGAAGT